MAALLPWSLQFEQKVVPTFQFTNIIPLRSQTKPIFLLWQIVLSFDFITMKQTSTFISFSSKIL